jgi:sugar porter (SP) family MFS transporter
MNKETNERPSKFAFWMIVFIGLGSFLYGYTTGIIAPALLYVSKEFSLSHVQQGTLVSIILIAALFGAMVAGSLADWLGRKKVSIATSCFFLLGGVISFLSPSYGWLLIGRVVSGFGVGLISLVAPIYLAEIAPTSTRGAFVSVHQFALVIGILLAYGVGFTFSEAHSWRTMILIGIIPAAIQICTCFFTVESPSILLVKKHQTQAKEAFKRLSSGSGWETHLEETKKLASHKKEKLSSLVKTPLRRVVMIGTMLAIFQQITGINTVIYYAPTIFKEANFSSDSGTLLATMGIGLVNVIMTFVSLWLMDRLGRKKLLIIGQAGMVFSLGILSLAFFTKSQAIDLIATGSLIFYVAFFSIGLGPVTWVLLSEIYPLKVRGIAMGCATFANWLFNYLVSLTFLDLVESLSSGGVFFLYALITILGIWFTRIFIPETKGKSLEEIERSLNLS